MWKICSHRRRNSYLFLHYSSGKDYDTKEATIIIDDKTFPIRDFLQLLAGPMMPPARRAIRCGWLMT